MTTTAAVASCAISGVVALAAPSIPATAAPKGTVTLGINGMNYWSIPLYLNWWKMPGGKRVHLVKLGSASWETTDLTLAEAFARGFSTRTGISKLPFQPRC